MFLSYVESIPNIYLIIYLNDMNIKRGLLGGGTNGRKWVVEKLTGDEYD
jgi:hypothetical protein